MMLTTKGRYAVMAMVDLAEKSDLARPISLNDIALSQGINQGYLEQIFLKLRRSNLVKSVKGPGGGYTLASSPEVITIADIINAVEEPIKMTRCDKVKEFGCLNNGVQCSTHNLWEGLSNNIHNYFSSISLKNVCNQEI